MLRKIFIFSLFSFFILTIAGCMLGYDIDKLRELAGGNDKPALNQVKVTFNANGGEITSGYTSIVLSQGESLKDAGQNFPTVERTGYSFVSWFTAAAGGVQFTATTPVTSDITIFARWIIEIEEQPDMTVRFIYLDGTYEDFEVTELGVITWGDVLSGVERAEDTWTDDTKEFAYWIDQNGDTWGTSAAEMAATIDVSKITLTSVFYGTVVTNDGTALERLSLENAGLAIYKFDLGANQLGDYKEFNVTYKVSEADINKSRTRHRVYGQFGTFASQADTTGAEQFDNLDIDGYQTDASGRRILNAPKFNVGGYIFVDGGRDLRMTNANFLEKVISGLVNGKIVGDTWFTVRSNFETPFAGGAANNPLTATGVLYYGLGLTSNLDGRNQNSFAVQNREHAPIVQLVKNVVLIHKTDPSKNITGTIPGAAEAQFMAYASPGNVTWCYRGAPNDPVAPPEVIVVIPSECADCGQDPCVCKLLTGDLPSPFVRAGSPVVTVVPEKGLKVQLASDQAGWAGIDFKLAAPEALAEGDVLKFKVTSLGTAGANAPQFMLQVAQSGDLANQHIGLLNIDETEQTVTIDAAILTKINASTFITGGGIRIRLNNAPTPADFLITSFTVERGATKLFDLAAWLTANK
ncbi:MAG: InlB B-repeat-containing protein [Treponema sp.]|nr:InlB B-repeat-containing protein [Treponema sp.]